MTHSHPLDYYLNLKYPMSIYPEEDGGYVVLVPDLPGCMAQGETLEEALANIEEARELWIETVYTNGKQKIPRPSQREQQLSAMDKLKHYRQIIKEILTEHSEIKPVYGEIQMKLVFDDDRDRYQLLRTGWLNDRRVYGALIHIDLEEDKIWIQYDGTEVGVANELVEHDIPHTDIVLAYHPPLIREYGDFAVS